jgi:predicted double-glycine peptidase
MLAMRQIFRPLPRGAIRAAVPDTTQQTDYTCGAACLQAVCKYYGVGPDDEWQFAKALDMDPRIGSHAFQIVRAAHRYGLECREYQEMDPQALRRELRWRHPVLLMIQAWGEEIYNGRKCWRRSYREHWKDGHWVVAIGFTRTGFVFEDPSLQAVRGFLTEAELKDRWRDTGPHGRHMSNYGVAIWLAGARGSAYEKRAEKIR